MKKVDEEQAMKIMTVILNLNNWWWTLTERDIRR